MIAAWYDRQGPAAGLRPQAVTIRCGIIITSPCHGRYLAAHIAGARYFEQQGDHSLRFAGGGDSDALFGEIADFLGAGEPPDTEPGHMLATILHARTPPSAAVGRLVARHGGQPILAPGQAGAGYVFTDRGSHRLGDSPDGWQLFAVTPAPVSPPQPPLTGSRSTTGPA